MVIDQTYDLASVNLKYTTNSLQIEGKNFVSFYNNFSKANFGTVHNGGKLVKICVRLQKWLG